MKYIFQIRESILEQYNSTNIIIVMEPESQTVYWEKQIYALCGVHCLNTLLQGPFFDEGKLAIIALELDAREKQLMEAEGVTTKDFLMYMAEDSGNVAEDGNYSIQVLQEALKRLESNLIIVSSQIYSNFSQHIKEKAFILHLGSHWFSIRKVNGEFYNFNSLYKMPELVPDEVLPLFLENLKNQGCQVWIVRGNLPHINKEIYKDLNDNQLLVSIEKIKDYTQQKIVENMINMTIVDGAAPHKPSDEAFVKMTSLNQTTESYANPALPKANNKTALPKFVDGYLPASGSFFDSISSGGAATIPKDKPSPKPTILKSNYEKFDLADPAEGLQLFQLIRNQIAQNLPEQQALGVTITFHVNDTRKLVRKFSPTQTIQALYDYVFIVLTSKPPKKKLQFYLQQGQTHKPILNVNLLISNISDQNTLQLKIREM